MRNKLCRTLAVNSCICHYQTQSLKEDHRPTLHPKLLVKLKRMSFFANLRLLYKTTSNDAVFKLVRKGGLLYPRSPTPLTPWLKSQNLFWVKYRTRIAISLNGPVAPIHLPYSGLLLQVQNFATLKNSLQQKFFCESKPTCIFDLVEYTCHTVHPYLKGWVSSWAPLNQLAKYYSREQSHYRSSFAPRYLRLWLQRIPYSRFCLWGSQLCGLCKRLWARII